MKKTNYPDCWDENRVQRVLDHYGGRSEEEALAEDEVAWEDAAQTFMEIPHDLIPLVRELLAKRSEKAEGN